MSPKILNLTKKTILSKDFKQANSFKDRSFGLLLSSNPRSLIFKTRFGLHTFFLKKAIDILVLRSDLTVVKLKKNLKPNKLFFWNPLYSLVIELPKNSIKTSKTSLGDKVLIQYA